MSARFIAAWLGLAAALSGCGAGPAAHRSVPAKVPRGFVPEAVAETSQRDIWLLGTAPCRSGRCSVVLRTRNGGRSFTRAGAPPLPTQGTTPSLAFVDEHNGFAYLRGTRGALYATRDAGATWQRQPFRNVLAFATDGSTAYAVTHSRLERKPGSSSAWRAAALPFTPNGGLVSLTARHGEVWLLGSPAGRHPHDLLARSADSGRTFTTRPGPCYSDLGGTLVPASSQVVWAVCPTGMSGGAFRSTDDGVTFTQLRTRPLVNSAQLAAASGSTAVLFGNGAGLRPMRTTDGGANWSPATTPRRPIDVFQVAFIDSHVGFALAQTGPQRQDLWRTTDGGAHWSELRIR